MLPRFAAAIPRRAYSTMRACQLQAQGELDVINVVETPAPVAAKGEVVFKVEYAGVNFIDTFLAATPMHQTTRHAKAHDTAADTLLVLDQRAGLYKLPMPFVLGNESAGIVTEVGEGVTEFVVGDAVAAYTLGGGFAEYAKNAATKTAKVPASLSTKDAATILLQGLTAITMIEESHLVKAGQFILVHAAAGGLGLLLCAACNARGAVVIGTTSTKEKAQLALAAGAKHCLLYDGSCNVVEEIYKITGGEGIDRGVHAVFDGVGKDTFEMNFDAVRRQGTIVSCGNASGAVPPFAPLRLGPKNLKITRPVLNQAIHTPKEFKHYTEELFRLVANGDLKLARWNEEGYPFTTEGIRQTQTDIMSRKTTGKLIVKIA